MASIVEREAADGAIREALADAQLSPADVGMIVAHGNGTRVSRSAVVVSSMPSTATDVGRFSMVVSTGPMPWKNAWPN